MNHHRYRATWVDSIYKTIKILTNCTDKVILLNKQRSLPIVILFCRTVSAYSIPRHIHQRCIRFLRWSSSPFVFDATSSEIVWNVSMKRPAVCAQQPYLSLLPIFLNVYVIMFRRFGTVWCYIYVYWSRFHPDIKDMDVTVKIRNRSSRFAVRTNWTSARDAFPLYLLYVFLAGDAREMRLNELRFIRAAIRFVTVYTRRSFLSLETRDEF